MRRRQPDGRAVFDSVLGIAKYQQKSDSQSHRMCLVALTNEITGKVPEVRPPKALG